MTLRLDSPRLHYRAFVPEDAPALLELFLQWQQEQPRHKYQFAVVEKTTGRLIGNGGVRSGADTPQQAELGCELHPDVWGQGYGREIVATLVQFAFAELKLHRLWAECLSENTGAWKIVEKCGFRREGHLQQCEWLQGRWRDHFLYALLASEWGAENLSHPLN